MTKPRRSGAYLLLLMPHVPPAYTKRAGWRPPFRLTAAYLLKERLKNRFNSPFKKSIDELIGSFDL
ncbi:hypothetical protein ACH95_21005 [Bacillus glycinifermentans]|uniref:Uncharacterized protein n=1 Tax=Bacillus glycinifermentans TaxID=1664069 RepID=A0A0J6H7A5_9BACI|nr:hypothetical protein COP00_09925 [Bacillus glycinifermentans]KMM53843.1 hypothetical protein ACH95_21005 [Bacillus glycinifermentans]KRT94586.1 hypothetical protein AB447_213055 [Bacillus glycinifermentans]